MGYEYWLVLKYKKPSNQVINNTLIKLENICDFLSDNFVINKKGSNMLVVNMTDTVTMSLRNADVRKRFSSKINNEEFNISNCYNSCKHDIVEDDITGGSKLVERIRRGIEENDDVIVSFGMAVLEALDIRKVIQERFDTILSYGVSYTEEIAAFISDRHGDNSITVMLPEEFENVYGVIEVSSFKKIKESIRNDLIGRFSAKTLNDVLSIKYSHLLCHFPAKVVNKILNAARGDTEKSKKSRISQLNSKFYRPTPVRTHNDVKGILEKIALDVEKKISKEKQIRKLIPKKFYLKFGIKPARLTKHYINVPLDSSRSCLAENSFKKFKALVKEKDLEKMRLMFFELGGENLEDISLNVPITKFFRPKSATLTTSCSISKTATHILNEKKNGVDAMNNITEKNKKSRICKKGDESDVITIE